MTMAASSGVEYTIGGVKINFPCKAYPSQLAMMNSVSVQKRRFQAASWDTQQCIMTLLTCWTYAYVYIYPTTCIS